MRGSGGSIHETFGISKIHISEDPAIAVLRDSYCVAEAPALLVSYNGDVLNVLNMTTSLHQCRALYSLFVCPHNYIYKNETKCALANTIVFAILQHIPQCDNHADCEETRPVKIDPILCTWAREMRETLCPAASQLPLCSPESDPNFSIKQGSACALTSPFCKFIVINSKIISTFAAGLFFLVLCCLIVAYTSCVYE